MKSLLSLLVTLPLFAACGDDSSTPPTVTAKGAVIVAGDFAASGTMALIDPTEMTATPNVAPAGVVSSDPLLRKFGDELFVINRSMNNITILNAATLALVEQLSTGAGSNPQDVAVVGTKLYVPTLAGKGVVVLTRGAATTTEIDLGADDPDGSPDCESIYNVDGKLYVACGLLDEAFAPRGPGKVYVVDSATDAKVATITLTSKNPFGLFERDAKAYGGDLVIPTVFFDDNSGCIERIATGATPAAVGCVKTNAELGGFANRLAFLPGMGSGDTMLLVAVNATFPMANLRVIDTGDGLLENLPWNVAEQHITDVVACPDRTVVVADQAMGTGGARVYANNTELTMAALDVGLPPTSSHGLVCY